VTLRKVHVDNVHTVCGLQKLVKMDVSPGYREGAIALYRQGETSFARAAELGGLLQEDLKHILATRGFFREVPPGAGGF
jgi:hypothetical protein